MNQFMKRCLITLLSMAGLFSFSTEVYASAFQIWEQSGASIGNYHAGYAAEADDASIAFFNPAGMTLIKNQQLVIGGAAVMPNFQYMGSVQIISNIIFNGIPLGSFTQTVNPVTAQGGVFSFVPDLHYVAPISDKVAFGFSIAVPFGLKTDYGANTALQYAATLSSIYVIDYSPDLALQINKQFSVGAGFDIQSMYGQFNSTATLVLPDTPLSDENTSIANKLSDTGYGGHLGVLYQFTPTWRMGLSYHTQVAHHLTGTSKFIGPLVGFVNFNNATVLESRNASADITLPAYTALSLYGVVNPQVAVMGSIIYTQWNSFNKFAVQNAAGIQNGVTTTTLNVTIPENYHNSWNLAIGADYFVTDRITLKSGLGYDQTPVSDAYRNVQLPDNNRFIIALGAHYQVVKQVGLDLGWSHFFIKSTTVNPPPQVTGDQTVITNGKVTGSADVVGAQITWDMV